jgi:excisionase family DNA binding protein
MSETKLLTTSEVAKKLGVTRWRVSQIIQSGKLKAKKFGQIYLINEDDLKDVLERPKAGRPAKKKARTGAGDRIILSKRKTA